MINILVSGVAYQPRAPSMRVNRVTGRRNNRIAT
jgi:hypothetical protein